MKQPILLLMATVLAVGLTAATLYALEPPEGMIPITIPEGAVTRKPHVEFPHAPHVAMKMKCTTCHHTLKGKDDVPVPCASSGCHDLANPKNVAEKAMPSYFRNAFHGQKRSCNACHWALKKAGKPHGPTDCKGCHIQQ